MPLHWTFNSGNRLVVVLADGLVTRSEVETFLTEMADAGALSYRKLFDGRVGETAMDFDDLLQIASRIRALHAQPVGPLAVVMPKDKFMLLSRVLGVLAAADRPMRIFTDLRPARRWIDGFALSASVLGDTANLEGPQAGRRADGGSKS